jgi:hypothetical protein
MDLRHGVLPVLEQPRLHQGVRSKKSLEFQSAVAAKADDTGLDGLEVCGLET